MPGAEFNLAIVAAQLTGGVILLWLGAEGLVRGAARLAVAMGLSPMIVGLTIVAFATSAPELLVSVVAAMRGNSDIALGNVIGSNLFNVLVILGLTALIIPVPVRSAFYRREIPIMFFISALAPLVCWDLIITRNEGAILAALLVIYIYVAYRMAQRDGPVSTDEVEPSTNKPFDAVLIVIGLGMLVGGSHFLVEGATAVAKHWGIRDAVIGVTVVAFGTSLPELATSVVAARRKQPDIALGNIIGSNIFNILSILGISSLVHPLTMQLDMLKFDIPVMIGVMAIFWLMSATRKRIGRLEGGILFAGYLAYTTYLVARELRNMA